MVRLLSERAGHALYRVAAMAGWIGVASIPFGCALLPPAGDEPVATSAERAGANVDPSPEEVLAAAVDDLRLRDEVRALCAFGARMGGTASGDRAVEYRARRLREAGLPVRILEDPETWCHEEHAFALTAWIDGAEVPLKGAHPYGFSPPVPASRRVPLSNAPDGAWLTSRRPRRSDLTGEPRPAVWITDAGSTDDGRFAVVHHLPPGEDNGFPVFGIGSRSGELLRAAQAEGRKVELEFMLDATIARARPRTVVASLAAAAGAPKGFFLVCAHADSDSGGPGANDNGSGEAIVLEMARVWSDAVRRGAVPPPAREVRFALWGKEIHSTRAFLERVRAGAEGRLLGVLNFDQAGYGTGADQLNVEPDDLPANEAFVRTAAGVLAECASAGDERFPAHWATNKSLGGTDSYVFSGSDEFEAQGLPAVTVFISAWGRAAEHPRTPGMPGESWSERDVVGIDYDRYYHSSGDVPENTTDREPYGMAWCARVGLLTVERYLRGLEPQPPAP